MALLPWHKIETVLLDMDGTLLDLHFDNRFWLHHIPQKLADRSGKPFAQCQQEIKDAYAEVYGQLEWYCLDYWAEKLDLDIMQAKRELVHLIKMREDCIPFLDALKASQREVVLVTNAHPGSLSLKVEMTQLDEHINRLISTHQFGVSKEFQSLWQQLQAELGFNPATTLFVDDSERILDAAKEFGIAYTLGITNPDSQMPENEIVGHPHTNNYHDLLSSIIEDNFSAESCK
ncbi:GMP/IMP nucleotidase [Glaciecola petra]|uniref:GMP/IMP nucleotidase n=1 Tax=Glaciecola petra TaxID=3075602 RepID=A0ABU2ZSA4_9ALTE|nr:GMP/IMP nucleotidase [Aestuariibacter sp. P117]MDT0595194.1 GMP/IMP nucleotidase [Aestuariibacter sp. P117]